jgi:arylsulfatase A-like enzyme
VGRKGAIVLVGWILAMAIAVAGCRGSDDVEADGRPNLVWILLDTLRAQNLSAYGYDRGTSPNMDALGARGALFEQAFSQSYRTRFSVPQYLTGRLFPVPGFIGFWQETWRQRPAEERYIGEILRENGYRTVMFTAHGLFAPGDRVHSSFEEVNPGARHLPGNFRDLNVLIGDWLDSRDAGPFFLYVHAMDTHFPHRLRPPHDRWLDPDHGRVELQYQPPQQGSYSDADREYLRGLYDGSIFYADEQVGRLLSALESEGELENTLFVISSDHGEMLAEDGVTVGHGPHATTDELFRVPLIIAGPGIETPRRVEEPVQVIDIVPTLVELMGLETGASMDGQNLVPLILGAGTGRGFAYSATVGAGGRVHLIRDSEARYLRRDAQQSELPAEELWAAPDLAGARQPFLGSEAKLAEMRQRLDAEIVPRLAALLELPLVEPRIFVIDLPGPGAAGGISPDSAYVRSEPASQPPAGRWLIEDGSISVCPDGGDAPAVTIAWQVPNGSYRVSVRLQALPRPDGGDGAGSAVGVRAQDDTSFHEVAFESRRTGAVEYVELGQYEVSNETFRATLDEVDPGFCASAGRLQFTPMQFVERQGITGEQVERLRALGYLD